MKKIILSLFVMLSILALEIKTKTLKADSTVTLIEGASIRLDNPAGLRFQAKVTEPVEGAKYGIVFANGVVAKENVKVGVDGVVKAEVDELTSDNIYAVSMVGIPERAFFSDITARAYILIDNTYIYSDNIVTRNINEVARMWKENNPDKQSDFITQVLSIAKLNTNGGTIRYENHEAMVEDFVKDFNTYSGTSVSSATDLYAVGNVYQTFFANTEMFNKWNWTLELFVSLCEQGYGNHQDAKSQYEIFLSKNGTSVTSQEYIRQSMQSLMTLSKCTSYNEESAIDFSLYKVSKQIEGAINGGVEFVNINNLPTTAYRKGYTFKGWYDENNNLVTTLTEGIELYAKWSENYQLEIDAAYDLTESTLDLPTTITINGVETSVTWNTSTFTEKQIGNQILTGTYTDEYNNECPIKIKVNVLPFTFSQNTSTKEYTITAYYGEDESVVVPSTYRGEKIKYITSSVFKYYSSLTNVYYKGTIEDWCNITFSDYFSNPMSYATHFYMKDSNNEYQEVTEIEIPDTITTINDYIFMNYTALKSITLPSSVTSISSLAFIYCSSLTNIYYDGTIEDWCNITFNNFDSNPMYYATHFYMKDSNNEYKEVTEIEIPDAITSIGQYQFVGFSSLKSITLPSNVIYIGSLAFIYCSSLSSIEIPERLSSIGDDVFIHCDSLTNVYYGGTIEDWCNIIFSNEYSNPMSYATHFYMKDSNNEYKEVTEIEISDTITSIGNYQFYGFSSLKSITIPSSVTSIRSYAFSDCSSLTNVYYDETIEHWCNITFGDRHSNPMQYATHFYIKDSNNEYKEVTEIVIPDTITSISNYRFRNFTALKSMIIPSSVTSIGTSAFSGCSSLTSIEIPSSVTSIRSHAFSDCSSLTNVYYDGTIEDWCNITFSNEYSNPMYYATHFYMKDSNNEYQEATEIEISDSITVISNYRFRNFTALKSISLPSTIRSISYFAFYGCNNLTSINVNENNNIYKSIDGNLYTKDGETLIQYAIGKNDNIFTIPEGVTSIGDSSFSGCSSLTSIEIPSSVTSIRSHAFSDCSSLTNVYYDGIIEDWCNITFSYEYSNPMYYATHFYMKDSNNEYKEVTEIEISDTITSIGDYQFCGFNNVTNITLHKNITCIGDRAFYSCSNLRNVNFEEGSQLTTIEAWTFANCASLVSIEIPSSVECIEFFAFFNCSSLTSIVIPSSVTSIGLSAFNGCSSLTIYCEAESQPNGWSSYWNISNCPVVWGYKKDN